MDSKDGSIRVNFGLASTFKICPLTKGGAISHNKEQFIPQKVMFNTPVGQTNYGVINGILYLDQTNEFKEYNLLAGTVHKLAFKAIKESGTTAVDITVIS